MWLIERLIDVLIALVLGGVVVAGLWAWLPWAR